MSRIIYRPNVDPENDDFAEVLANLGVNLPLSGPLIYPGAIEDLGKTLRISDAGIHNSIKLATGYPDIVVVLREPCDSFDELGFDEMLEQSPALQLVDESIRRATKGVRSIHNTIILDRWMFRSQAIRETETPQARLVNDKISFSAFDDIIACICPQVVLICWRTLHNEVEPFILPENCDPFRSAPIKALKAGCRKPSKMQINDHEVHEYISIDSFHPMFSIYEKDEYVYENDTRQLLFIFTFIQAVNALQRRSIEGKGIEKLRDMAFRERPCEQDVVSQELIDHLQRLKL